MIDIKGSIHKVSSFVSRAFSPITRPISEFSAPYIARWQKFVSPITHSWDVYCKRNPRESKIIKWIFRIFMFGLTSITLVILLALFGAFGKLPSTEELQQIENANASEIYTSDGVMIGKYYTENRTTIELDSISPYLITALLAIEDKRFFEHSGIDLRSWMRVFKGIATIPQGGGGSTLSQQLAKNLYPRNQIWPTAVN